MNIGPERLKYKVLYNLKILSIVFAPWEKGY